tara:strand:- start:20 stop:253 length:234 start_codon:yes stop_codon:yes gene_type:complete
MSEITKTIEKAYYTYNCDDDGTVLKNTDNINGILGIINGIPSHIPIDPENTHYAEAISRHNDKTDSFEISVEPYSTD